MTFAELAVLRCPDCGANLNAATEPRDGIITNGTLVCDACGRRYPVVRGIPRFAPVAQPSSYDIFFAHFDRIQLDRYNGTEIARNRLAALLPLGDARALGVTLQVGCGSGRYADPFVAGGVELWAIDLSYVAVEACAQNLSPAPGLHLAQADVYCPPFPPSCFDTIYALGVLMAVPDPPAMLRSLYRHLRPGGQLVVDVYRWRARGLLDSRWWLRPLTTRLPAPFLWLLCRVAVLALWPLSRALGRVPRVGRVLRHLVPICNYDGILPLPENLQRSFSLLDTFDILAARYAHRITPGRFQGWLSRGGFTEIEIIPGGMLTGRAVKLHGAGQP